MEPVKETEKEQTREVREKPGALRRGYVKKEGVIKFQILLRSVM